MLYLRYIVFDYTIKYYIISGYSTYKTDYLLKISHNIASEFVTKINFTKFSI